MAVVSCSYTTNYEFDIPADIAGYLMTKQQRDAADGDAVLMKKPGYWWIKWATFYYIDKEGNEQEISSVAESEEKWPDTIDIEFENDNYEGQLAEDDAHEEDSSNLKCAWCNCGGVDKKNENGVWVHEDCE